MAKIKIKPLLPTLREKKRYIAFEFITEAKLATHDMADAIMRSIAEHIGVLGLAKAGVIILKDKFKGNKGLLRVSHKHVEDVKSSMMLIENIKSKEVIYKTLGVSGIMKKAYTRYIGG